MRTYYVCMAAHTMSTKSKLYITPEQIETQIININKGEIKITVQVQACLLHTNKTNKQMDPRF